MTTPDTSKERAGIVARAVQAYSGAIPRDRAHDMIMALAAERDALRADNDRLREYYKASEAFAAEKTTGNGMRLVRARAALDAKP
jgi:hypothetical protein